MEAQTGKILEAENEHLKRAPASVVKLMLAAVVLEKLTRGELKLTDKITVTKEASKMGGSQVYLEAGETFTLEDMMKAVLIASGNDAAYAVAEHVAGTAEAFIKLMNEKAKALNMVDSRIPFRPRPAPLQRAAGGFQFLQRSGHPGPGASQVPQNPGMDLPSPAPGSGTINLS